MSDEVVVPGTDAGRGAYRRAGNWVFGLTPAGRCALFAFVAAVFCTWSAVWTHHFLTQPGSAPFLDHGRLERFRSSLYLAPPLFLAISLASLCVLHRPRFQRAITIVFVQAYFIWLGWMISLVGVFTTDAFGALGITGAFVGTMFFERRAVWWGICSLLLIVTLSTGLQLGGVLPYAPWYSGSPYEFGRIDLVFAASYGSVLFLTTLVSIVGVFFFVSQWRALVEREASLQTSILAEREHRLTWLESLAGFLKHELRNQLTGVDTSLALLASDASRSEEYLTRARTSIEVMRQLVATATEATSLEAAISETSLEPIELSDLVDQRVSAFLDEGHGRRLEARVMGGVSVLGSEPRLIQLLDKLLENAVAHSSASSEIRLSLTISNGLAVLAVENQGSALPSEPERLFEPFVSEAKGRQNLGLGLFVVRRITELHAGRVRALPLERGCGVRFEVSLPRIETQTSGSSQR